MYRIDEDGKWEVIVGEGYISQRLIEPSQKYIDEHPEEFLPKPPTAEDRLAAVEEATLAIMEVLASV
jgi:hypothetical protein